MSQEKKEPITFELFSIGNDFKTMSENKISSLYEVKTFKMWTYMDIELALYKGDSINIRPATHQEMNWAWKELGKLIHENFNK